MDEVIVLLHLIVWIAICVVLIKFHGPDKLVEEKASHNMGQWDEKDTTRKMVEIPRYLREYFVLDTETRYNGFEGSIRCTCGNRRFKVLYYGEEKREYIQAKPYEGGYGLHVACVCTKCNKTIELFDMAKHGYNGFVCQEDPSAEDAEHSVYSCYKCGGDEFEIRLGIIPGDREQFVEEVVSNEPDRFTEDDYIEAFGDICISLSCVNCKKDIVNWLEMETM